MSEIKTAINGNVPAVTRFAPSPTGHLHLGHAYSALFAAAAGQGAGGSFLVRIEDIDAGRCRTEFEDSILEDLRWLGLEWETPVRRQSECMDDYAGALEKLHEMDLLYPCFCTRKDIREEIERAGDAPHGPDGPVYPGICRGIDAAMREDRMANGETFALRLDIGKALSISGPLTWIDHGRYEKEGAVAADLSVFGDVVLARKDIPTSYHLACTIDDHLQGVTLVTRGEDLFAATHVHRLLQRLLDLDTPQYHHHGLIKNEHGERLAKRDKSLTIRALREVGKNPEDVRKMAGIQR
ncbi:MAG: tRNA glutamyl-Q(34) synthetase GluQRS [Rhodospirillales bacterium]